MIFLKRIKTVVIPQEDFDSTKEKSNELNILDVQRLIINRRRHL